MDFVKRDCVVVVDPFSTGAVLAENIYLRGFQVIALYSTGLENLDRLLDMVPPGLTIKYSAILSNCGYEEELVQNLCALGYNILAVVAGTETGVELADKVSEIMMLRTNGSDLSEARRNKFLMGETIRTSGLRAVKEFRSDKWENLLEFLVEWDPNPFEVILKPIESAGGEDVTLCRSINEAHAAFNKIIGKINGLGLENTEVLVQEYLNGPEYIVDMVSRDGVHKLVHLLVYDRAMVNGAPFVMRGYKVLGKDEPRCQALVEYQKKVITALGIRNGPSHGEVKWIRGEPVLMEVGARCHGVEGLFIPIVNAAYGHDQVEATVAAYLFPEEFAALPDQMEQTRYHGYMLFMNPEVEGTLKGIDDCVLEKITSLTSYHSHGFFVKPGDIVRKCVDCFTHAGYVRYIHEDENQIDIDHRRTRELVSEGLFLLD